MTELAELRVFPVVLDAAAATTWSTRSDGTPDFAKMTSEQRLAYHKARLNKKLGWGR
jgi:hypothetical protein